MNTSSNWEPDSMSHLPASQTRPRRKSGEPGQGISGLAFEFVFLSSTTSTHERLQRHYIFVF